MAFPVKEFQAVGFNKGTLAVGRNHTKYNEGETLSVVTYDELGNLKSNLVLDLKQTKRLRELLGEIIKANEDAKPKEPTVPEQIEALPVGSIFSIDKHSRMLFARTGGAGTISFSDPGWEGEPAKYKGWQSLYVHFNPKEEK